MEYMPEDEPETGKKKEEAETKRARLSHILGLWKAAEIELSRMENGLLHSPLGLINDVPALQAYNEARKALLEEEHLTEAERDVILREEAPSPPKLDGNWKGWVKEMRAHLSAVKRNLDRAIQR